MITLFENFIPFKFEIVGLPSGEVIQIDNAKQLFTLRKHNLTVKNRDLNLYCYDDKNYKSVRSVMFLVGIGILKDNYTLNKDGSVDVYCDIDMSHKELKSIPIEFNNVYGNFNCSNNLLRSLYNGPKLISGDFDCSENTLKDLFGAPDEIYGDFNCSNNLLESIEGGPQAVYGIYKCNYNLIKTLDNLPTTHIKNISYMPNEELSQHEIDRFWKNMMEENNANINDIRHLVSDKLYDEYKNL